MLRLNFCVRYGNRWIPQAIATGNLGLPGASWIPDSLGFALLGFTLIGFTLLGFALLVLLACLARRLVRGRFAPASLSSLRVVRLPRYRLRFAFRLRACSSACRSLPGFRLFVNSRFSFAPCTLKTAQVFESRDFSPASARLCATNALARFRVLHVSMPSERSHRLRVAFAFALCSASALLSLRFGSAFTLLRLCLLPACIISSFSDQALDRLVSSSCIRCRTSTDDLSTSSSLRGLTHFQ